MFKKKEALKRINKYGLQDRLRIFSWILDDKLGNPFEYIRYKSHLRHGKVYLGPILMACQGSPVRHFYMQQLVRNNCSEKGGAYKILEVGSWAGGSAITFAEAIRKYNNGDGIVICIDPWRSYINIKGNLGKYEGQYKKMERALTSGEIFHLFQHNVKVSGNENLISAFRGTSNERLPILRENHFDLVYLDGDHSCDAVLRDLQLAAPLLKDGGILCGDDLEIQFPDADKATTEAARNLDAAFDPKTGKGFHPGVTSAVWEFFKQKVSAWEGFWAMRKKEERWERLLIETEGEPDIPYHLRNPRMDIMREVFSEEK